MGQMDPTTLMSNLSGGNAAAFSPTFGNVGFMVVPSDSGEVSDSFAQIPYLSLESLFMAQGGGQIDPNRIGSGMSQGNAVIQGQTSIQDSNGLTRMVMGYSPAGF